jgi:hypothetical protein
MYLNTCDIALICDNSSCTRAGFLGFQMIRFTMLSAGVVLGLLPACLVRRRLAGR